MSPVIRWGFFSSNSRKNHESKVSEARWYWWSVGGSEYLNRLWKPPERVEVHDSFELSLKRSEDSANEQDREVVMRKWSKVQEFNPNSQDPDNKVYGNDPQGNKIHGKGQTGGGSKPTPQAQRMTTGNSRGGSYKIGNSSPKSAQRLRG
jgi:hypothetical protein